MPRLGRVGARRSSPSIYGLDWIATVPPTVRLTSDAFGKARAGVMFGWIVAAHQLGAAAAALGAGTIRSWTGDYERAFLTSGALCLITAGVRPADRPGAGRRRPSRRTLESHAEPAIG